MNIFIKNSDYRRFSLASFLSSAGDILFYLAFMTYASKLKNYSLALSLIAISESVPRLFEIFGGYLADKTKKKFQNIFLAAMARFILYALVGLLFISKVSQWNLVIIIVVVNFLSDTIGSYSGGLITPLIVDIVGKKNYGEAAGFTSGVSQVISMSAQFVGSALLLVMSYSSLAFVNAATFLLAGILFASVGLKHQKGEKPLERKEVNEQGFFETMKSSFIQVKKQQGLLTIVLVMALLNGSLMTIEPLNTIVMAAHRSTMIIGTYSFTLAVFGVVSGAGLALGSIFGPQLLKKVSVFALAITASGLSVAATLALFTANIYVVLVTFFLLAATVGVTSIKLEQWLVTAVEHRILASTAGLLNTILTVAGPALTTLMTTVSGTIGVNLALVLLLIIEAVTLITTVVAVIKVKKNEISETGDKILA
ncbi:MAG: MFS transporter [Lactobacillus crispatus]|jgi:MFS family permease|uniref:MFS transporter n=1 Tax=Lactobacillus crispatus TaxID=47770 RepID=UPI0018AA4467|nr:MFS transporter [Lactobacillus crispatus]MCH4003521.1 MFS transporter [Lactobacillus crispatus]MCI1336391.1 MFS transporter [Lactobacillus crispatus]MCI1365911.1 MFS transporter [Lactobacillus crispatus]MCI1524123.1 MFS transporter [Lactobacillus crispatus]MCI1538606.1 MFS transporter [Lactobacillus crispatus]